MRGEHEVVLVFEWYDVSFSESFVITEATEDMVRFEGSDRHPDSGNGGQAKS